MSDQIMDILRQMDSHILRARQDIASLKAESLTGHKDIEFMSQFGEDMLIWELLGRQTKGFFIEAGAFDGYHYSVSYAFEKMGWTGILVEPIPDAFIKCRQLRTNSACHHRCLSSKTDIDISLYVTQDNYGGMLSTTNKMQCRNYRNTEVILKTVSLNDLLALHRETIDFLSLDLEGGEYDALCGLDLSLHRPRIVLIEQNDGIRNPSIDMHMRVGGYVNLGCLEVNQIWVRSDEREIIERFNWMRL